MTLEEAAVTLLLADAGVSALAGTRIWALRLPQNGSYPAVRLQRASTKRDHTHSGASGLVQARLQVDSYAASWSDASSLAAACLAALDGYSGTAGTVSVQASFNEAEEPMWEDDLKAYRVRQDYMIWHAE